MRAASTLARVRTTPSRLTTKITSSCWRFVIQRSTRPPAKRARGIPALPTLSQRAAAYVTSFCKATISQQKSLPCAVAVSMSAMSPTAAAARHRGKCCNGNRPCWGQRIRCRYSLFSTSRRWWNAASKCLPVIIRTASTRLNALISLQTMPRPPQRLTPKYWACHNQKP